MRIAILHRVPIYRDALSMALTSVIGAEVWSISHGHDAPVTPNEGADIVIVDVGSCDDRRLTVLREACPHARFILLCHEHNRAQHWVVETSDALITDGSSFDELVAAAGWTDGTPNTASVGATKQQVLSRLTGKQREIYDMLEQRLSNKQIARRLGIQLSTVKNHVHNLRSKGMDIRRRQGLQAKGSPLVIHVDTAAAR